LVELTGAADGQVAGQVFVYFIAQKIKEYRAAAYNVRRGGVTSDVLKPAQQHELKEDNRAKRGLPHIAVDRADPLAQKLPVESFVQATIDIMAWQALGQTKAHEDFVGKLLVALHRRLTYGYLIRYFCN
jgi:hypothetical protein